MNHLYDEKPLHNVNRIDSKDLTSPAQGKSDESDNKRGKYSNYIIRKVYKVACKSIFNNKKGCKLYEILSKLSGCEYIRFYGISTIGDCEVMLFEWAEHENLKQLNHITQQIIKHEYNLRCHRKINKKVDNFGKELIEIKKQMKAINQKNQEDIQEIRKLMSQIDPNYTYKDPNNWSVKGPWEDMDVETNYDVEIAFRPRNDPKPITNGIINQTLQKEKEIKENENTLNKITAKDLQGIDKFKPIELLQKFQEITKKKTGECVYIYTLNITNDKENKKEIRIATYNVRGINKKQQGLQNMVEDMDIDILGISETKKKTK
ncbi:hypothetical protein C1645_818215 [Glomus cerebriforme]|uniref:Endonuclease/exonuclease/phosphatase n=1 Tax=Glomus cerebriforme TaxID=658196 RepID=A0A397TDA8_9GLOM|nr:hypothetical protein C1645_818215 [Glomus cerebriforme]